MPSVDAVATAHYRAQARLGDNVIRRALGVWRGLDVEDLFGSWAALSPTLVRLLTAGQVQAALDAAPYLTAALGAQGTTAQPVPLNPAAFAGVASDGRSLQSLLVAAPVTVLERLQAGASRPDALLSGWANLAMHLGTQMADAGRAADATAMVATPEARRWVRMIEFGACSRCAVLAGRVYKWKADFERHPRCRCRAIPLAETDGSDWSTDPRAYFDALSPADQDRLFTKAGAEAIRHGADVGQVVNARRGMSTAQPRVMRESWARGRLVPVDVYGRPTFVTSEGMTRRGVAYKRLTERYAGQMDRTVRLMPESIFALAKGREDAVRLLRLHGYIL